MPHKTDIDEIDAKILKTAQKQNFLKSYNCDVENLFQPHDKLPPCPLSVNIQNSPGLAYADRYPHF